VLGPAALATAEGQALGHGSRQSQRAAGPENAIVASVVPPSLPQPPAAETKQAVRERIWALLEAERAARFPGARGRIPNFRGAEAAAARFAESPEWSAAAVVKANPDAPQLPVRRRALADGKRVYMAVPRLREEKPFTRLGRDATIKARDGRKVKLEEVGHVDLVVCGTVAVNRKGVRVGKGGGYSDLEFALLVEAGLVDDATVIATTVHDLQLVEDELPATEHDFCVDVIVTPTEVLRTPRAPRRCGIVWEHLDEAKIESIPLLRAARDRIAVGTSANVRT
jgi:5-formyltetrahydrofolate cyclo-ligase